MTVIDYYYNFKEKKYLPFDLKFDWSEFIPQDEETLALYRAYVNDGRWTPQEAAEQILFRRRLL